MLKEAIEYLFTKGHQSASPIVKPDAEPAHVYFLRNPDGTLDRKQAAPPPAQHTAHSLATIAAVAEVEGGECWFSSTGVVLRHGADLRDRTTFPLILSDHLKQLISWRENRSALTQPDLIRVLRTTFRDALVAAPTLLDVLKKVRFNSGSVINTEVGHGKASLGKEIMGEVTGTGLIPEYVRFNLPVFANASLRTIRANVECALEPDAASGQFRVIPLPGQIEDALDAGTAAIGAMLRESLPKDFLLYQGTP